MRSREGENTFLKICLLGFVSFLLIGVFPKFNSSPPKNISNNQSNIDFDDIGNQYKQQMYSGCSYENAQFTGINTYPPNYRYCITGERWFSFTETDFINSRKLNQRVKTTYSYTTELNEYRVEGNELVLYSCKGFDGEDEFDCIGRVERNVFAIRRK